MPASPRFLVAAVTLWLFCLGAASADERPSLIRLTTDGHFKQRPAWSPDGTRLCFARHHADTIWLYLIHADGSGERRLTSRRDPEYDAAWSADGQRLAFTRVKVSGTQGDLDVYTISAEGSDERPFAVSEGKLSHEESPAWRPDGSQIAFTSTRDGNQELYVANADGSQVRRLTSDPGLDAHPAWSPDGAWLAFATDRWGDLELALVKPDGSDLRRLTTSRGLDDYPSWSPDGRRLAFTSNREGNFEIYLTDSLGEQAANVTRHEAVDNFAAWAPDGRLTFISNRDGGFEIYLLTVEE
jgi:TolB protein